MNSLEKTQFVKITYLLLSFFNNDLNQVLLWLETKNPMLGGVSPFDMCDLGRTGKLLKFVEHTLAENK